MHLPRPLYRYRRHASRLSVEKRREQREDAAAAIRRALARRGLDVASLSRS